MTRLSIRSDAFLKLLKHFRCLSETNFLAAFSTLSRPTDLKAKWSPINFYRKQMVMEYPCNPNCGTLIYWMYLTELLGLNPDMVVCISLRPLEVTAINKRLILARTHESEGRGFESLCWLEVIKKSTNRSS